MPLWDKLKTELDRAGKAAQQALDEGKLRLEVHRARQLSDKFAQQLGYAVFHARRAGGDLPSEEYGRLSGNLTRADGEVARLERLLDEAAARRKAGGSGPPDKTHPS